MKAFCSDPTIIPSRPFPKHFSSPVGRVCDCCSSLTTQPLKSAWVTLRIVPRDMPAPVCLSAQSRDSQASHHIDLRSSPDPPARSSLHAGVLDPLHENPKPIESLQVPSSRRFSRSCPWLSETGVRVQQAAR
eukprot:5371712-Pyramimonas_sp.AAC.3